MGAVKTCVDAKLCCESDFLVQDDLFERPHNFRGIKSPLHQQLVHYRSSKTIAQRSTVNGYFSGSSIEYNSSKQFFGPDSRWEKILERAEDRIPA